MGGAFEGGLAAIRLVPAASGTGAPTTGAHQVGELYADSTGALFYCTVAGSPGTWLPVVLGSSGASLTTVEASLASDVSMSSGGTWYDGPSVSLTTGTWLLVASVTIRLDSGAYLVGKLWDGTNVEASGQHDAANPTNIQMGLGGNVTVSSTTTWKVSFVASTSGTIRATTIAQPTGQASKLVGIKVG